ncbi:ethylene-responsive transcription factor ERF011-like [Quercus suber]|uniref:ethylene-responsive transcription factor ERF011-like n=1 Tax=Quercus suber TaxID=58331 RepID=UPI0032DFA9B5
MSCSSEENGACTSQKKYKGVRQRKWGKWVSEIRVPGTQERLWLGSYSTPEAAAMARDVAFYCLHKPSTLEKLNFPSMSPSCSLRTDMSPRGTIHSSPPIISDHLSFLLATILTSTVSSDHLLQFNCNCFRCYMSYWVESPNRQVIHEIIDAFEAELAQSKSDERRH